MDNPVGWFEIYVSDMERATLFYESVFGYKLTRMDSPGIEMMAFPMSAGGSGAAGALVKMSGVPSGANSVVIYFVCKDCAIEAAKAEQAGGKLQKAKMSIGEYGFIALIVDTEGNMIGLHSMH